MHNRAEATRAPCAAPFWTLPAPSSRTPPWRFLILALPLCTLILLSTAHAQSSGGNAGTVRGAVLDPTGAVIKNATVEISNPCPSPLHADPAQYRPCTIERRQRGHRARRRSGPYRRRHQERHRGDFQS